MRGTKERNPIRFYHGDHVAAKSCVAVHFDLVPLDLGATARGLNGGKQERDQHGNGGDNDEQLDQGKPRGDRERVAIMIVESSRMG